MKIDQTNDIKNNLERYFNSVIKTAQSDKEFFVFLADYWAYLVRNDKVISKAANEIIDSNRKATELLKKLEIGAAKAIETAYKKITKSIENNKIESPEIKELQDEFEGYRTGRILSSAQLSDSYQRILTRLIMHLRDSGHKDLVKSHIVEGDDGHIREFLLPRAFIEKTKKSFELEDTEKKGLWKAWNNLIILYLAYFEGYKHADEIEKDPKRSWEAMNFRGIASELEKVISDKKSPDDIVVFFKREDFKVYITRIHNYLMSSLSSITEEDTANENRHTILDTAVTPVAKVTSIEIYKEKLHYCVLVNNAFPFRSKIKTPDETEKMRYWDYIYEIATSSGKQAYVESTLWNGVVGYFNSNLDNPLYKNSGLAKTFVLRYYSDYLTAPDVRIEKMKTKKYNNFFKTR